jgi:hypothetical protein
MKPRERLARLHFVNTILHSLTGHDLYLASQLLEGIEHAAAAGPARHNDPAAFAGDIDRLHETLTGAEPDAGFTYLECAAPESAGPLWVRESLLHALDAHSAAPQATVMIGNAGGTDDDPRATTTREKPARIRRRAAEYAETISNLRDVAAHRANPQSLVTLLFV